MRILYIGDRHVNIDTYEIYIEQKNFLLNYFKNNNIDLVIELGDFFHGRKTISKKFITDILQNEFDFFTKLQQISPKTKYYRLVGNHDILSENKNSLLTIFNYLPNVEVIDSLKVLQYPTTDIILSPYILPNKEFDPDYNKLLEITKQRATNNKYSILCGHNFPYFLGSNESIFSKEIISKYDKVFLGHFHNGMDRDNVHIVGSTHQVRIDESFVDKYIIDYDTEKMELNKIEMPYPKFKEIIISDEDTLKNIITNSEQTEYIKEALKDKYTILKVADLNLYNQVESLFGTINAHLKLEKDILEETDTNQLSEDQLLNIDAIISNEISSKLPMYFQNLSEQETIDLKKEITDLIYTNMYIPQQSLMDKDLVFESIELKNFIVAKDVKIDLENMENSLYFVQGLKLDDVKSDSNGAGKSLLFVKSILYGLYGKNRRLTDASLFNDKQGYVKIKIKNNLTGDSYEVERGVRIGNSKGALQGYLNIYKNGTNISHIEKNETQKIIEEEIISKKLLTSLFILDGTQFSENFFKIEPSKQIEFLSNLTMLDFIDNINTMLTEKLKGDGKKHSENSVGILGKKEAMQSQLQLLQSQLEEENEETIAKKIQQEEKEIELFEKERKSQIDKLEKTLNKIKVQGKTKKEEVLKIEKSLKLLESNIVTERNNVLSSIIAYIEKEYGQLEDIQKNINNLNLYYKNILNNIESYWKEISTKINQQIAEKKQKIQQTSFLISNNEAETAVHERNIKQYTDEINTIQKQMYKEGDSCGTCSTKLTGNALKQANKSLETEINKKQELIKQSELTIKKLKEGIPVLKVTITNLEKEIKELEKEYMSFNERYLVKKQNTIQEQKDKTVLYTNIISYIQLIQSNQNDPNILFRYPEELKGIESILEKYTVNNDKLQKQFNQEYELYLTKKNELGILTNQYYNIENQIKLVKTQPNPHLQSLKVIQDQLNTIKQKRVQLQKLQNNLLQIIREENKLRLLIDVFSRKGLKQKLLKNYLNALSAIFKKQLLNYDNGSIEFIESKGTLKVQLYHKGKLKDFEDLSGGEKVKYIMAFHEAIALLFQKIYNLSCNIRVYDEILNNLDTVSTSEVLDSITNKLQHNKNVKIFMIDHTGLKDVNKKQSVYVCNYDNQAYFFSNLSELLAWITPFYNKNKILNSEVKYYIEQLLSLQNEQNILVYNTNVKEEKDNTVKDTFWEIF